MPNKIKTNPETPILFQPSGNPYPSGPGFPTGANLVYFGVDGLPNLQGRISNQYDLGPGPRTTMFEWRGKAASAGNPNIGNTVEIYLATSNSVAEDGAMPTIDSNFTSSDKRRNLQFCGAMQADSSTDPLQSAGLIEVFGRYISLVWWNNLYVNLGTGCYFILTPVPDEIQ